MLKQKLTPWFPADVKPVRVGLYQREYDINSFTLIPDLWDGTNWILLGINGNHLGEAIAARPWRGLASDPKASKP